jgi:hypothetical protein
MTAIFGGAINNLFVVVVSWYVDGVANTSFSGGRLSFPFSDEYWMDVRAPGALVRCMCCMCWWMPCFKRKCAQMQKRLARPKVRWPTLLTVVVL